MQFSCNTLRDLEAQYGDSFYVLDVRKLEDNYRAFLAAFRAIYPDTNIAYSYKTNYTPWLCQQVNRMGAYAEVVSSMEYDLAQNIGVPPQRIIFNGPLKLDTEIECALSAGSIVNLDSFQEARVVEALARKLPERRFTLGVRCNFDLGDGSISRFGLDVESGELSSVFETFDRLNNCRIIGLHCHFSSRQRSAESYAFRTRKILELSSRYFQKGPPKFIDVGGGFFGNMSDELKNQFGHPVPSYQDYAQAIAPQVAAAFPSASGPELILEPGIALVGDTMMFVSKVVRLKSIRSRHFAVTTGSIYNIKPTLNDKNLPMRIYSNGNGAESISGVIDITGYTCMEIDYLFRGYEGTLSIGDYLVFDNAGAYTNVLKPPFIRENPPIIAYDSHLERYELIKRQEEFSDVFSTYVITEATV